MRVLKPILLAIALTAYSRAQTSTGRIAGTVTDSSGAFVKGATVTIINGRTNEGRCTITNDDGNYVFTALEPSAYTLTASMSGFSGVKITDLNLQVGQELRRNLELTVSSNTAVVDVEG